MALPFEQPRARVSIEGVPIAGLVELEVSSAGRSLAGCFSVGFALGTDQAVGASYFASLSNESITIEVAADSIGYATLLTGLIDGVRIDWVHGLAVICGRDLTALLIDSEISQSFVNQSASQIAETIAVGHGLIPNITPTSTMVGQYYQRDHARTALGLNARVTTEWELLTGLAEIEGFFVSVTGSTLNFGPLLAGVPIYIMPESLIALSFDMITALPTSAAVKSWNCRNKSVVSETFGSGQVTTIIRPNLVQAQAQALAQGHLQTLNQHRLIMRATMPADTVLAPGMLVEMCGVGAALDQTYVIDAVTRRLAGRTGYVQDILAHSAGDV